MTNIFKKKHTYEKRIQESNNIMGSLGDTFYCILRYKGFGFGSIKGLLGKGFDIMNQIGNLLSST